MVVGHIRRRLKRRHTNRQSQHEITFPLPTHLWRRVARRILENSVHVNITDQALNNESEDRRLELMVSTAPFNQIRANPMAWALFMRGYEVGRHFTLTTAVDLQQNQEPNLHALQFATPWFNQVAEESTPSLVRDTVGAPVLQEQVETDIPAEMALIGDLVDEVVTLSADDALSPWLEETLTLMEESQSMPTEVEQAHDVLSAIEDSTTPEYGFLLDDNDLEL